MNKEKILRLYKDFSEGKFITPNQKKVYETGIEKLKQLSANSGILLHVKGSPFTISPVALEKTLHPRFIDDLYESMLSTASTQDNQQLRQQYGEISCAIGCMGYVQATRKDKALNENIYVITPKVYNMFAEMPLPDITFKDVSFPNDLPAVFLMEEFNTVAYLNYFLTPVDNNLELILSIFGYNPKFRFEPANIIMYSRQIPEDVQIGNNLVRDFVDHSQSTFAELEKELINRYAPFFYNLLLFIACKETIRYLSSELNPERSSLENNIAAGTITKKQKQVFDRLPSYRFVDMEITLDNFAKEYYRNNPVEPGSSKASHWRSAHWHSYWTGKKDGSQERKKVLRFIPTLWVGDPGAITEQASIKVIK